MWRGPRGLPTANDTKSEAARTGPIQARVGGRTRTASLDRPEMEAYVTNGTTKMAYCKLNSWNGRNSEMVATKIHMNAKVAFRGSKRAVNAKGPKRRATKMIFPGTSSMR